MKKWAKILLIIIAVIIGLFLLTVLFAFIFKDQIVEYLHTLFNMDGPFPLESREAMKMVILKHF